MFSLAAASIYIPTSNVQGLQLFHILFKVVRFHLKNVFILVGMKWCLVYIFTLISLMTNDVTHLFLGYLAILQLLFEKFLLKSFIHFFIGQFLLLTVGVL